MRAAYVIRYMLRVTWLNSMKKIYLAPIGVIILALIIIIPAAYLIKKVPANILPSVRRPSLDLSLGKLKISSVGSQAFGSLKAGSSGSDNAAPAGSRESSALQSSSVQPSSAPLSAESKMIGGGGGGSSIGMPNPFSVKYNFIYTGGDFSISDSAQPVLKRAQDDSSAKNFAKVISGLNFGLFDISRFKDQELANFNINEDREFGYSAYFNLTENMINIAANWNKWPRPETKCEGLPAEENTRCYELYQLKKEDLLPDEKIIAIAGDFIKEYNIDMSNYGSGEVQKQWQLNYGQTQSPEMVYIPESVAVIYPLIINGQTVYDESGNKTGLAVEVSIRHNKVSAASNIMAQNYQSSDYDVETDPSRIIKIAQIGGYNRIYSDSDAEKTVDIELGTPSLELVKIWKYDQPTGASYELLAPFYVFPIVKMPEEAYFWQKNIIVPAVKEILDETEARDNDIRPMPSPLAEPARPEKGADVSDNE